MLSPIASRSWEKAPPAGVSPELEEILRVLPGVPAEERRQWINYLKYLQAQLQQKMPSERPKHRFRGA
jgi:hypothetical protein